MIDLRSVLPGRLKEVFRGETQEATAKKLSTVQGTISKWLSGEVIPPTEMILLIAEAYKVSVDWLFGLSEQKQIDGIAYEKITYADDTVHLRLPYEEIHQHDPRYCCGHG